jgi:hypothetical protein
MAEIGVTGIAAVAGYIFQFSAHHPSIRRRLSLAIFDSLRQGLSNRIDYVLA